MTPFRAAVVTLACLLLIASCGGGDDSQRVTTPATPAAATAATPASTNSTTRQSCTEQTPASTTLPVSLCISAAARARIRELFQATIADGSIMQLHGGFDPRYYPGEVIASVMAIAEDTGDAALMQWSIQEIIRLRDRIAPSQGVLIWPEQINGAPTFGELAQARLVLSMALIYRATGNVVARETALSAFAGLRRFPRIAVRSSITGRSYSLPAYAYHNVSNPVAISGRTLDPNHDAVLAATYAVMANHVLTDQAAIAAAANDADHFFAAAEDMAHAGRCLPLADQPEYVNACDTRYNGYWAFLLELFGNLRPASTAKRVVDVQFAFARQALHDFKSYRTYPHTFAGDYPDPVEPLTFFGSLRRNMSISEVDTFVQRTNTLIETNSIAGWPRGNIYPKYYQ